VIRLACPSCSKKLAVEDSSAGSVCKCPSCANKFRVPDAAPSPEPPAPTQAAVARKATFRDSAGRSSSSGRPKSSSRSSSNGKVLDQLEVIGDDPNYRPRRNTKKGLWNGQPQWVQISSVVAGILLCGFLVVAIFSKYLAIALIVVGLPGSLLSRKWRPIGIVGVAYLLTGASFFLLHATLLKRVEGPPARGATAREVDLHCTALLRASDKVDGSSWVGVERPNDSQLKRGLRTIIKGAYEAGAVEVYLMNRNEDSAGLLTADLVVVLPEAEDVREHVLSWYQHVSAGKRAAAPGDKYLYVSWD